MVLLYLWKKKILKNLSCANFLPGNIPDINHTNAIPFVFFNPRISKFPVERHLLHKFNK